MLVNLFWETRRLTAAREEHLTAFIAAALNVDTAFRRAYAATLLGPLAREGRVPAIATALTEVVYREERCRVDMVLDLDDGRRVAVEHKIDAAETPGVTPEGEAVGQLRRYLDLPVDHVAFVRSTTAEVTADVRDHPRYLRPGWGADHYLWRDLHAALTVGEHDVTGWILEAFDMLGYTPPVPHVGDLSVRANRENFAKLWQTTRSDLTDRWTITTGSICELYLRPRSQSHIGYIYVSPSAQAGGVLLVRIQVDNTRRDAVHDSLQTLAAGSGVTEIVLGRAGNGSPVVDVHAPLHRLLSGAHDTATQQQCLAAHVVPLVRAAECAVEETGQQPSLCSS